LDFLDFTADTSLPNVPKSFGGVSGGGLWKVLAFESPSTGKIDSTATLERVAFFQTIIDDSHSILRCHGPETIAATSSSLKLRQRHVHLSVRNKKGDYHHLQS
jgi:hypothetical protein